MSINKRRLDILKLIMLKNSISIDYLSDKFSVTNKTIRNDFKQINNFFKTFSNQKIIIENSNIKFDNIGFLNEVLKLIDLRNYTLNNEERIIMSTYILLISSDYVTTSEISDFLLVSKSSVFNDIDLINKKLLKFDLSLESSPGKGLLILGDEINFRETFYYIINNYYYLIKIIENTDNLKSIYSYFDYNKIRNGIYEIIAEVEYKYNIIFSEKSFKKLLYYLIYLIFRIKNSRSILKNEVFAKKSSITSDIISLLNNQYNIDIGNGEYLQLYKIIKKLKYKYIGTKTSHIIESQFLTRYLIDSVSKELNIPLYLDYELYESLSFHIERIKNNRYYGEQIDYDNEILNLVINNKKLYDIVTYSLQQSEKYFKESITRNEIYYILIYLYISIERLLNKIIKELKVTIVCNSGIGTSQLISLKLKDLFNFKNIRTVTSRQLINDSDDSSDIILSTVNLPLDSSKYLKVSPVITTKDSEIINSVVLDISHKKLETINYTRKSKFLFSNSNEEHKNKKIEYGISSFLTKENIILDIEVKDWKESIMFAGNILVERNKINRDYINEMIENINKYGPYIVISKGVALPHASISNNVKETSFLLVRLKKPVNFGVESLDPVKYVCILAVNKDKNHIKALFQFNNLINNKEFRQKLDKAKGSEEVEKLVEEYSL